MQSVMTTEDRFWAKVEPTGFCWLWRASAPNGYGRFNYRQSGKLVQVRAHRMAYELLVGPIPPGLQLDHLCRVPLCVNPDHLEPVTGQENTQRAWRVRVSSAYCKRGHEFTSQNTYVSPNSNSRTCRACLALRGAAYHKRKTAAQ